MAPYIDRKERTHLDEGATPVRAGQLNYAITRMVWKYLGEGRSLSYSAINEVIGVLEAVKLELYRRVAAGYEDTKKADNGDVYL